MLREIPNDYRLKREYLDKNSDKIEVLFLGGSHVNSGLNPVYTKKRSFNAAYVSQTLDYDFEILRKYNGKWSSLDYIVLAISYATLFEKVEESIEGWRVKNYVIYYKILITNQLRYHLEILNGLLFDHFVRLYKYYFKKIDNVKCTELGWQTSVRSGTPADLSKSGIEAAERATLPVNQKYFEEMTSILDSIIDFAKRNKSKLIMLTTPAFESYRANLNQSQMGRTISLMNNIVKEHDNCYYINLLDDNSFTDKDFRDGDHLNGNGARKLTLKIDSIINNKRGGDTLNSSNR